MDQVFNGLDCAFVYLDDILVGSANPEEHLCHLHAVLQRLRKFGLVLNLEKCQLGRAFADFPTCVPRFLAEATASTLPM